MKVFIQNEAGSDQKHYHDEKTLVWQRQVTVSRPYPYPYGFVIGTTGEDGWNVDCFVMTSTPLSTGEVVDCEAIGLMEQIEDGEVDHNVLAVPAGARFDVTTEVERELSDFVAHVFDHIQGKDVRPGRFLDAEAAEAYVGAHGDQAAGRS